MLTGKKLVAIVDIDTVKDIETGDRRDTVVRGILGVYTVELVGVNTAMLGQTQGFNFSYSVIIDRIVYDGEKYLFFDGKVYEIKSFNKAQKKNQMLLNVQVIDDDDKAAVIKEWIENAKTV